MVHDVVVAEGDLWCVILHIAPGRAHSSYDMCLRGCVRVKKHVKYKCCHARNMSGCFMLSKIMQRALESLDII